MFDRNLQADRNCNTFYVKKYFQKFYSEIWVNIYLKNDTLMSLNDLYTNQWQILSHLPTKFQIPPRITY